MLEFLHTSFGHISGQLCDYICSLYQPGERFPYPLQRGQKGNLFGTAFATYVFHMLDKTSDLPGKQQIADIILSLRNPATGLFADPDITPKHFLNPGEHSELYVSLQTSSFCYACLQALDVDVDCRIPWIEPLLVKGQLAQWLDNLDWSNPWLVSNLDMFVGNFLLTWHQNHPDDSVVADAVDEYFMWHDKNQDPHTGFWGEQQSLFSAMAGGYHIFIHYDYANRQINYADKVIDSTLRLVARDGLFVYGGGGGSCEDMDAIDILVRCSLLTDYRQDDVKQVLLNAAQMLSTGQLADGGFSWRVQPCIADLFKFSKGYYFIKRKGYNLLFKGRHRSHYTSVYNYSSLKNYPYQLNQSDTWSSWFRPLTLAFIAQRYPEHFSEPCTWRAPDWPGLGFDPFLRKVGTKDMNCRQIDSSALILGVGAQADGRDLHAEGQSE